MDAQVGDSERITDFEGGVDKLALYGELRSTDAPLHFIGSDAFSGTPGEVRFDVGGGGSVILVDIDGDARIDMVIRFDGEIQFQQSDFLF